MKIEDTPISTPREAINHAMVEELIDLFGIKTVITGVRPNDDISNELKPDNAIHFGEPQARQFAQCLPQIKEGEPLLTPEQITEGVVFPSVGSDGHGRVVVPHLEIAIGSGTDKQHFDAVSVVVSRKFGVTVRLVRGEGDVRRVVWTQHVDDPTQIMTGLRQLGKEIKAANIEASKTPAADFTQPQV